MKTYTCEPCGVTLTGVDEKRRHDHSAEHDEKVRAADDRKRHAERTERDWKLSRLRPVTGDYGELSDERGEFQEPVAATVWKLTRSVMDAAERLEENAGRLVRDLTDDIKSLQEYGIARLAMFRPDDDVSARTHELVGRRDTLAELSRVLGFRCLPCYRREEWKYLEALALYDLEPQVDPAVPGNDRTFLVPRGTGSRDLFETRVDAVIEACDRARRMTTVTA